MAPATGPQAEGGAGLEITPRIIAVAFLGGVAGMAAMTPILIGPPAVLGAFRAQPLLEIADLGRVLGSEPNLVLGLIVLVAGGAVAIPLLFVIAGAFLPPREPRAARGVTFALVFWTGFVLAFWPGIGSAVLFLAASLLGHLVYGLVLGGVLDRFAYIPQHAV